MNREKIGRKCKRILKHNDVISIAHPAYEAFVFKDQRRTSYEFPEIVADKYHFAKKLGSGACGTVFLVYDYKSCEAFALKHIKKNTLTEYKRDKALNEAQIMKSIKHPCVVKMYDIVDSRDSVYITLELMKGGDLLTRIQKYKFLPEKSAKLFFYQMCHAIKYLHDRNITHRDLKPDNILLESSEEETLIKISDFGLSKLVQNNSVLRTLCGTPLYVAPEVLLTQGRGEYTKKVDIWSLGVVLFTCLSGTLPFANEYGSPATEQIKRAYFQFRSNNWKLVSKTAKSLICELLTADVTKRPSIDELLMHEWLDDYEMKCRAHEVMNVSPPPVPTTRTPIRIQSSIIQHPKLIANKINETTNSTKTKTFIKPLGIPARKNPINEDTANGHESGQPSKRRRIC